MGDDGFTKPIFVLGKQRSGTTWLANQISQHHEIAAVRHPAHEGVHESVYFSHIYKRFGDLTQEGNFAEFVDVFGTCDYAMLAGVTSEMLWNMWPDVSYESIFKTLMDRFAREQEASYWLEKSPAHTPFLPQLLRWYPDGKFVGITRDTRHVLASTLAKGGQGKCERLIKLVKSVFLKSYYDRLISAYSGSDERVMMVFFAEFKSDQKAVLERICSFLSLEYDDSMGVQAFPKNSSFESGSDRKKELDRLEIVTAETLRMIASVIPLKVLEWGHQLYRRVTSRRLPLWFWKLASDGRLQRSDARRGH